MSVKPRKLNPTSNPVDQDHDYFSTVRHTPPPPPSLPHSQAAWPAAPAGQVSVLHQSVQTESPSVLELLKSKETRSLSTQTGIQARLALNVQFLESIPVLYPDTYFEKEEQLRGYEMSP